MREQYSVGDEFGRYRLQQLLGAGGFGAVWRARDTASDQVVALKLLSGAYSAPDAMRLRAEVELLAASASSASPHVVRVLGGGPTPVPHVVMEYVEGEDLAGLLRREGALPPARVVEVGKAVADALRALGQAGIIHRDLKPANVMIDSSGVVKLADFGIAKIVGYETVTATGQVLLSTAYSAPEVWEGRPSERSDLYALGALLYECLTGRTPFVGTTAELFRQHSFSAPDLDAMPSDTPASLRELIELCLEKSPEARPRDAAACLELLDRARVSTPPSRFGDWSAISPHPSRHFSYICRHETTGEIATVEVFFDDRLEFAESLRRAVTANPRLVPLGAERLLGTNRLVLHPDEAWDSAPPARFTFWVARAEVAIRPPAGRLNASQLARAASQLQRLRQALEEAGLPFEPHVDDVSVGSNGAAHLRRPGLPSADSSAGEGATMTALRMLPLTEDAHSAALAAPDLASLAAALGPADIGTVALATAVLPAPAAGETTQLAPSIAPGGAATDAAPTTLAPAAPSTPVPPPIDSAPGGSPPDAAGPAIRGLRGGRGLVLAGGAAAAATVLAIAVLALTRGGGDDATPTTPAPPPVAATPLATPAPVAAGATFRGGPERSGLQPGPAPDVPQPLVDWFMRTGRPVGSSPVVANGAVIVGSDDGFLYTFEAADGRERGRFRTGGPIRSSPAVIQGIAYFGSDDGNVYALNVVSGQEVWRFDTGGPVPSSPAVVTDTVFVGAHDGRTYALDAKRGTVVWEASAGAAIVAAPAVWNSVVYIAGTDGVMYAMDARTGAEKWRFTAGSPMRAAPAFGARTLYVGDDAGFLHAVAAETGQELWSFRTGGPINASAAVAGGVIFIGSGDRHLYAVDATTGLERWKYRSGGPMDSSPAIVTGDEVRYVASLGAAETVPAKTTTATGSFTCTLDPATRTAFYTLFVPEIEDATIAHIHLGPPGVAGPAVVTLLNTPTPLKSIDASETFDGSLLEGPLAGDFDALVRALEAGELYLNVHTVRNPAEEIRGQLHPDATGVIYVGSSDGQLHAVDAGRGVKLWSFQTGGPVTSSPAVVGGVVYFGSSDGSVYALGSGKR